MNKTTIKEIGTVNLENIECIDGQISVFIPVEVVSEDMNKVLDKLKQNYRNLHQEIGEVDYSIHLHFSFGYANPEFEITVLMFDKDTEEIFEFYDGITVNLTDEQSKAVKKVMWDNLGKNLLNL